MKASIPMSDSVRGMLLFRAYLRLLALKSALLFSDVENFGGSKTKTDYVKNVPIYVFQLSKDALMLLTRIHGNFNVGK